MTIKKCLFLEKNVLVIKAGVEMGRTAANNHHSTGFQSAHQALLGQENVMDWL